MRERERERGEPERFCTSAAFPDPSPDYALTQWDGWRGDSKMTRGESVEYGSEDDGAGWGRGGGAAAGGERDCDCES